MATNPLKKTIVLGSNVLNISKKHSKTQKKTKPIVMAPSINASSMRKKLLKRISDIKSLVMELYRSEDSLSKMKEGIAKVKRPHAALDIAKLAIDTLRENG